MTFSILVWLARLLDRWGFVPASNAVYRWHSRAQMRRAKVRKVFVDAERVRAQRRLDAANRSVMAKRAR